MDYNYDSIDLVFAVATTDYELQWSGARIYVDSSDADFTIKLNSNTNKSINMKSKSNIEAPFDRFYITTTGAANITLFLSNPKEIRLGGQEVNVDIIEKLEKTSTISVTQVSVDNTVGGTLLAASNTDRKEIRFKVKPGDPDLFVGESGLTTADGFLIEDGAAEVFSKWNGAWYGIIAVAGPTTVYVVEEG